MFTPVGTAPNLPAPPDRDLVPAHDLAVNVPASMAGQWTVGSSLMGTVVRVQADEMVFKINDHFFSTRPVPGVVENYKLSLQVSQAGGQTVLVPLLPLSGQVVSRATGAPSAVFLDDYPTIAPAVIQNAVPKPEQTLKHLSGRLDVPSSITAWLQREDVSNAAKLQQANAGMPQTVDEWVDLLVQGLSQSGLFFESQLAAKKPIPTNDLKRQLLQIVNQPMAKTVDKEADADHVAQESIRHDALLALDDLTNLQGAALVAHRLGGECYSFVLPAPDQQGAWWMTLTIDPPKQPLIKGKEGKESSDEQPDPESNKRRWQVRLGGINLPFGDLDIRIDQYQQQTLGVTVVTPDNRQAERLNRHRPELATSLEQAGLSLSQFEVLDRKEDRQSQTESAPPLPGQVTWISV